MALIYFVRIFCMQLQPLIIQTNQILGVENMLEILANFYQLPPLASPASDLMLVSAVGSIGIKQVLEVREWNGHMPYASSYKVAVINDADRLTPEAQNSLLKTLEEPAEQTIIALVTRNYSKLLPTILSRCSVYQLEDEGESKNSVDGDNFFNAKAFYRADYLERLKIIGRFTDKDNEDNKRELALSFVKDLFTVAVDLLKQTGNTGKEELLTEIGFLKTCIKSLNASGSVKLILEQLCICLLQRELS